MRGRCNGKGEERMRKLGERKNGRGKEEDSNRGRRVKQGKKKREGAL